MREFLFTLTYNNLTDKKELNFIVGETSTPPTWNTVKDHATKITRAFDSDALKSRRVYFSATEKLTGISFTSSGDATMDGAVVDLSQDGKTESEITKADAAGIMVPASSYYVFVYDYAGGLVKQQTVTTAGYPDKSSDFTQQVGAPGGRTSGADYGEYIWGMDGWQNSSGIYDIVKGVEVKRGEVFFLPMRVRSPDDWDIKDSSTYCPDSVDDSTRGELQLRRSIGGASTIKLLAFSPTGVDSTTNLFSFTKSSELFQKSPAVLPTSETDETLDFMYLAKGKVAAGNAFIYKLFQLCSDIAGTPKISSNGYSEPSFTLITE